MLFDLADENIRARVSSVKNNCYRLTIDYPRGNSHYRDLIYSALAELLRPQQYLPPTHPQEETAR